MPHATSTQNYQDAQDDALIQQALDPRSTLDFTRDLEPGEKAEDAIDFGDLSDDDLADDDNASAHGLGGYSPVRDRQEEVPRNGHSPTTDSEPLEDVFDDLFGDDIPQSSEHEEIETQGAHSVDSGVLKQLSDMTKDHNSIRPIPSKTQDRSLSKEQQLQQELFALSRSSPSIVNNLPEPPANDEELLAALWPKFERESTPRFMDLLPPKKARYVGKQVLKAPKPVNPNKVNLELAQDQEKSFRLPTGRNKHTWEHLERQGVVAVCHSNLTENRSEEETDLDSISETGDGRSVSWRDLQIMCEDWDPFHDPDVDDALSHWDNARRSTTDEELALDEMSEAYHAMETSPAEVSRYLNEKALTHDM